MSTPNQSRPGVRQPFKWHVRLRQILDTYFDENDLETLCFDLSFDYESLGGGGKTRKIIELIRDFARLGRIEELVDYCSRQRPNVPWDELREAAARNPLAIDSEPDEGQAVGAPQRRPAQPRPSNGFGRLFIAALGCLGVVLVGLLGFIAARFLVSPPAIPVTPPTSTLLPTVVTPKPSAPPTVATLKPTSPPTVVTPKPTSPSPATSEPGDCLLYKPANLRIVNEGAGGWLLTDGVSRMLMLDNEADAKDALSLASRYTAHCFIGRGNTRSNRQDYIVGYWSGYSGLSPTFVDRDCIALKSADLRIVNEGASGWLLTDGVSRILMLDDEADAKAALSRVKRYTAHCFIGRGNTRSNRQDYIVEYWK